MLTLDKTSLELNLEQFNSAQFHYLWLRLMPGRNVCDGSTSEHHLQPSHMDFDDTLGCLRILRMSGVQ